MITLNLIPTLSTTARSASCWAMTFSAHVPAGTKQRPTLVPRDPPYSSVPVWHLAAGSVTCYMLPNSLWLSGSGSSFLCSLCMLRPWMSLSSSCMLRQRDQVDGCCRLGAGSVACNEPGFCLHCWNYRLLPLLSLRQILRGHSCKARNTPWHLFYALL